MKRKQQKEQEMKKKREGGIVKMLFPHYIQLHSLFLRSSLALHIKRSFSSLEK